MIAVTCQRETADTDGGHKCGRKENSPHDRLLMVQAGLLHHSCKSINLKGLRIRAWVDSNNCQLGSYAHFVAPGAASSLLQMSYVDQEKRRKSHLYKDLCLHC